MAPCQCPLKSRVGRQAIRISYQDSYSLSSSIHKVKYFGNVMGVILTPATASVNHDCFSMSPWTPLLGNLSTTYRLMTQNPARSSRRAGGKKKPKTILQSDNVLGWAGGGSLVHEHSTGSGWNPVLRSRHRVPVYLSLA